MRRAALVLGLGGALAGCTIGPDLATRLQATIGQGEGELVSAFGVPTRTYQADGRKFLQYEERRTQAVASDPYWARSGRYGPLFSPGPAFVVRSCDITFTLEGGKVASFSFRGEACR
jgi:hypothetical protein